MPEKGDGFRQPSMQRLHEHWQRLIEGYGLDDRCAEFVLENIELPKGISGKESLPALKQWVQNNGEG